MAILRDTRYPGRWQARTNQYPQGAFKNKSSPTATDGSYAEQDWLNDWDGFFGRLLTLSGVTPNGNVDNATSSQYFDALSTLFPLQSLFTGDDSGYFQIPVLLNDKIQNVIINWSTWSGTTVTTSSSGTYEFAQANVVSWKKPFSNKIFAVLPSVEDTSTNFAKNETVRYWTPTLTSVGLIGSCDTPSVIVKGYVLAIGY
ncbi:MAG: hypothetical protein [Caudoviricetes sp.]|nr:MAG: hypothetical protein [Caudoviricetes sp.]